MAMAANGVAWHMEAWRWHGMAAHGGGNSWLNIGGSEWRGRNNGNNSSGENQVMAA
jgi:hypothetical protein